MRCTPRTVQLLLLVIAGVLLAWTIVLGSLMHGQAEVRNWSVSWIGMDLLQVVGLVVTSQLLARRARLVSPAAAATATLLILDAWFDVMTAEGGAAWYLALAMAAFAELPAALWLAALSRRALDWTQSR